MAIFKMQVDYSTYKFYTNIGKVFCPSKTVAATWGKPRIKAKPSSDAPDIPFSQVMKKNVKGFYWGQGVMYVRVAFSGDGEYVYALKCDWNSLVGDMA